MTQIKNMLQRIASEKKVEILFACETGSRGWGFPSTDSDYDVRFIYQHPVNWYLSLHERKDTIEVMEGELDITGWDIRKCLRLMKKSNVALIERFQSPIVYAARDGFKADFARVIENYYSPMAVFYHHFFTAKKYWDDLKSSGDAKLKGYFYLMRSLLSCHYVTVCNEVLPMELEGLLQKFDNDTVKFRLRELVKFKATVDESYRHAFAAEELDWIVTMFTELELKKEYLKVNTNDSSELNEFFLKTVYETTDNR
jgi:predicted nucleotidyltransferase